MLRAGVAHRLRRQARGNVEEGGHPEFAVVVFDAWSDDPIGSLRSAVRDELAAQFGSALLDEAESESLADTFDRWTQCARLRPPAPARSGRGVLPLPRRERPVLRASFPSS